MAANPIDRRQDEILRDWERRSRALYPAAWDKAQGDLRDHLPQLLGTLARYLRGGDRGDLKDLSRTHGRQRFSFGDYTLGQLLGEYRLLKQVVLEFDREDARNETVPRVLAISTFFDEAATVAASEFAELREEELNYSGKILEASRDELERFSAVVAHDLRSPLATIVGFCDVLAGEVEREPARAHVGTVRGTAARAIDLIDRLLEYTRVGQGRVERRDFELGDACAVSLGNLHGSINDRGAKIEVGKLGRVKGDPVLVGQLFQNLLGNALKFTKPGRPCEIHVAAERAANGFRRVCVRDNGVGFRPEQARRIFQPFERAHAETEFKGSGLGLATCQKVVEAHGGTIEARGEVDRGATFCFTLPDAGPSA